MFKFGFSKDKEDDNKLNSEKVNCPSKKMWLKSEEIKPTKNFVCPELLEENCEGVFYINIENDCRIRHISSDIVAEMIREKKDDDNSIFKADQNHSDLVTAVYEGGLKIWQCTYDLLDYIAEKKYNLKNKKVLDLGCGAGIIGLYSFIHGAKVYFQDYNPEVLRYITLPNVLINESEGNTISKCRFYSGDWASFVEITNDDFKTEEDKFDYIFTSETIYNCDNFPKLLSVFKERLKKDGTIILAAKTYYFGVGGGTREFESVLNTDDCFKYENCWKYEVGVQREIMKINFK